MRTDCIYQLLAIMRKADQRFTAAGNLEKLALNGNQLGALPALIGGLTRLKKLALQENSLTELPSITSLEVTWCSLIHAHRAFISVCLGGIAYQHSAADLHRNH